MANPYVMRNRDGTLSWDYANDPAYLATLSARSPAGPPALPWTAPSAAPALTWPAASPSEAWGPA
eukprot:4702613-Alexandrium_andersonii.AAC.1